MTHKKNVGPKYNSDYSTVLILWKDYYENGGVTRNQLHHILRTVSSYQQTEIQTNERMKRNLFGGGGDKLHTSLQSVRLTTRIPPKCAVKEILLR